MSAQRVVITGFGVISALGRGREQHLAAVSAARSGIAPIRSIDASSLLCRIAGEVPAEALGDDYRDYDRFTRLALIAAAEALTSPPPVDPSRFGCMIGTGLGGSSTTEAAYARLYGEGGTRLHPLTIPRAMYNAATSAVAATYGAQGPGYAVVSACASANHAIGQAFHWIRSGVADAMIAGGADAPLTHGVIRGWEGMRVLAAENDAPETACRPFSADRKGLVLAEGAGVFLLERREAALERGATIYGEVVGFGMSNDAGHLTDPSPDGAARAMSAALADAALPVEEISYINAHGTATRANDSTETRAIKMTFGAHATRLAVSSTKAMHGHAMGASGAIELATTLAALRAGIVPPTINLRQADPECDLDYVANEARRAEVAAFLSNSFGFGGFNAVLALRMP